MGMLGGSVLFWPKISCRNTKFGLINWRVILNLFDVRYVLAESHSNLHSSRAIAKRFLQGKRIE